jgi:hypothetical protein
MDEKEPEVIHLEWERVQDPTREPPPEMVVAEPRPEPQKGPVRRFLDQPNPFAQGSNDALLGTLWVALIVIFVVWRLLHQPA